MGYLLGRGRERLVYIALQKLLCCYANKLIASGIWYTYVLDNATVHTARNTMSKTISIALTPSRTWFSRLLSVIDHVLMTNAEIAVRNGDLPYFGL
jgi:hypothetical protein